MAPHLRIASVDVHIVAALDLRGPALVDINADRSAQIEDAACRLGELAHEIASIMSRRRERRVHIEARFGADVGAPLTRGRQAPR